MAEIGRPVDSKGLGLVLLSTGAYASLPILTKVAYGEGLHPTGLLALRFSIAALFFTVWDRERTPLDLRLRLWAVGSVFLSNSFAYFKALESLSAAQTALLFYVYPVLVALLAASLGLEPLTLRDLAAASLAFCGAALASGGGDNRGHVAGVVYALVGAVLYASYIVFASRVAARVPPAKVARHIAELGAVSYLALATFRGEIALPTSVRAWASVLGIAVFCTIVAHAAFLAGLARVGPARAAVASSLEVALTLILAVIFLRERMGPRAVAGASLILGAVALHSLRSLSKSP